MTRSRTADDQVAKGNQFPCAACYIFQQR
jgi:hypothetical protein